MMFNNSIASASSFSIDLSVIVIIREYQILKLRMSYEFYVSPANNQPVM